MYNQFSVNFLRRQNVNWISLANIQLESRLIFYQVVYVYTVNVIFVQVLPYEQVSITFFNSFYVIVKYFNNALEGN